MQTVTVPENYQIASNFIAYNGLNIGYGGDEFDRYNKVRDRLSANNGIITEEQAVELLSEIGTYDEKGNNRLQWTVIYNLNTLEGKLFAGRKKNNLIDFAFADYWR